MKVVVELNDTESAFLKLLEDDLDMSAPAILRAALRLYQSQHLGRALGYRHVTLDKDGVILEDKVYGCMALD